MIFCSAAGDEVLHFSLNLWTAMNTSFGFLQGFDF